MLPKILSHVFLAGSLSFLALALLALIATGLGVDYFMYALGRLPLLMG